MLPALFAALAIVAQAESPAVRSQESSAAQTSNSAQDHIMAGLVAYRRLRFREAERHFQAAVDADPQNAGAHFYLGYAIYKIAEPKRPNDPGKRRALAEFTRAYELDPSFTPDWRGSR